MYSDNSQDT